MIIFGVLKIQACVSQQYGNWKGIETRKYDAGLLCDTNHRLAVHRELHMEYFSGFFACVHMSSRTQIQILIKQWASIIQLSSEFIKHCRH